MNVAITKTTSALSEHEARLVDRAIETGDLAGLSAQQRRDYYYAMCKRYNLDPLSRPFDYITSYEGKGDDRREKLALYPNKTAGAQMRRLHGITLEIVSRERIDDMFVVTARAKRRDGSSDESIGVVSLTNDWDGKPLQGNKKAIAMMKAETKARQRATMAVCGLLADEPDDNPTARVMVADALDHGLEPSPEIIDVIEVEGDLKLSEKIAAKISEIPGLKREAVAAVLTENNINPKKVDTLPASEHGRVLSLIDAIAGG